jgi:preprotein translocase subunit SecG
VEIAKIICMVLQVVLSIVLIVIVMAQTTKSEGLTGSIGGQVTSSFKGKPGMDEQIRTWTIYISVAWFAVSTISAIIYSRV